MAKKKSNDGEDHGRIFATPMSPSAKENQMISLAIDLAERKLRDGTASSQLICHYLDMASPKEQLRQDMMRKQNELIEAKTKSLQSAKHIEELYTNAIIAMREYAGANQDEEDYTYLQ